MKIISSNLLFFIGLILSSYKLNSAPVAEDPSAIIEKIEQKYEAIRKEAPSIKTNGAPVAKRIRFIQESDNVLKDYSKLRQIVLIRHGEPNINKCGKFNCDEANQFLKCYDSVCIIQPEEPFFQFSPNEKVAIYSSPLNRALSTAHYLCGNNKSITILPEFREFENKISSSNSQKRRSIKKWTAIARLKWMLGGKSNGIESFSDAKARARKAANILADASKNDSKVLLTSHGMLNRYIKKNLKKMGWKVVTDTGNDYLGTTILVKIM
jgi:hypothetical protein